MKKSILLVALLALAVMAAPASASVQNIKVGGSIDSTFIHRVGLDFGAVTGGGDELQNDFITQTIIDLDADLTDQVSAKVGLINEKPWGEDSNTTEGVDIYNAYLMIREMLYSPLTVTIGRQNWAYGNSAVFDSTGTNNLAPAASGLSNVAEDLTKQTALDAIRATFDYSPLIVDMFYAKVSNNSSSGGLLEQDDDKNLYGINGTYNLGDDMNTQVEAYFFALRDKSTSYSGGVGSGEKTDTIYVKGARTSLDVLDGLNAQLEVAHQSGTDERDAGGNTSQSRNAFLVQAIANYKVPNFGGGMDELNPMLQYVYTWASGNSAPGDTSGSLEQTAWDPFFEAQGGGSIFSAVWPLSNVHVHQVSLSTTPLEDVTTTATWTGIWLDKEVPGTFSVNSPNTASNSLTYTDDDHLGNEFGITTVYDYTEDVQFGLNTSWFLPGDALAAANDSTAYQILLNTNVNF